MKRHLNTLFIQTQGTYLAKDGECVSIKMDGKEVAAIPIHTLGSVICFGQVSASPYLLGMCAEKGVSVSFLSRNGRFLASVQGPVSGNVLLRREQYRRADSHRQSSAMAQAIVAGKIANCRTVLRRSARDRNDQALTQAADGQTRCMRRLQGAVDLDEIRGVEGEAAGLYFKAFDHMIGSDRHVFRFTGRNRRPPLDPMNCLLSFVYTLLLHDVRSALECEGLDPCVGFLHRDRPGRPSLALDMMEEFRPYMADRLCLTLVNKGQVAAQGFRQSDSGAVLLQDKARKAVLMAYQERKQETVEHPFIKERTTVGLTWHIQARLLNRYLRGDLDAYPPFVMR